MMARAAATCILATALGACSSSGPIGATGAAGSGATVIEIGGPVSRNVDVLFMIDNSASMTPLQNKFAVSFSSYVDTLEALPGGLPSLHVAVVSSSMGAGRNPSIDYCPSGGDRGVFQTAMRGTSCATGTLDPGQTFIVDGNGRVLVSVISGPPSPYVVNVGPSQVKDDPSMWPFVQHSCIANDGTYADPAIRLQQFASAFGPRGLFAGICDDFAPTMQAVSKQLTSALPP